MMAVDDEELELLRRKKLEELKLQREREEAAEELQARMEAQKQLVLRQVLEPEARERLGRLRIARPDVVSAVENQIVMLAQSGRISGKIDDATLVQLLSKLLPKKREIRIERR
jgi:programmed cell death protein 5